MKPASIAVGGNSLRRLAPSPTRRVASASRVAIRSSPSCPGAARTSRCTRFLAILPSGTFWMKTRGPLPSGSTSADLSLRWSWGTPHASSAASHVSNPLGGGARTYPSASAQKWASASGSALSNVTWNSLLMPPNVPRATDTNRSGEVENSGDDVVLRQEHELRGGTEGYERVAAAHAPSHAVVAAVGEQRQHRFADSTTATRLVDDEHAGEPASVRQEVDFRKRHEPPQVEHRAADAAFAQALGRAQAHAYAVAERHEQHVLARSVL